MTQKLGGNLSLCQLCLPHILGTLLPQACSLMGLVLGKPEYPPTITILLSGIAPMSIAHQLQYPGIGKVGSYILKGSIGTGFGYLLIGGLFGTRHYGLTMVLLCGSIQTLAQ